MTALTISMCFTHIPVFYYLTYEGAVDLDRWVYKKIYFKIFPDLKCSPWNLSDCDKTFKSMRKIAIQVFEICEPEYTAPMSALKSK